jgi:hypothetical protein
MQLGLLISEMPTTSKKELKKDRIYIPSDESADINFEKNSKLYGINLAMQFLQCESEISSLFEQVKPSTDLTTSESNKQKLEKLKSK